MKLAAFGPRFLLESVEGGERLARYSFIGFGDGLEVRLDDAAAYDRPERARASHERAAAGARCAPRCMRRRSRNRTSPACRSPAGWLATPHTTWCATSSACRRARGRASGVPALHYVAPRSVLVFDHLTRGIALRARRLRGGAALVAQRSGAGAARRAAEQPPRRPLRAARAPPGRARTTSPASGARRSTSPPGTFISWCWRAASAAGTQLDPFQAYRALRLINPSPYMYYCALGDVAGGRLIARGAGEAQRRRRAAAAHRRHPAALGGGGGR